MLISKTRTHEAFKLLNLTATAGLEIARFRRFLPSRLGKTLVSSSIYLECEQQIVHEGSALGGCNEFPFV